MGRLGFLDKGVPVSGVMDAHTASIVNGLLENETNAAVLEITMTGPTVEFTSPTYICFGGADMHVALNEHAIAPFKVHKILKGDILSYGKLKSGFRNYLAIKDGFRTPVILNSRSYFYPITKQKKINKGDELMYLTCEKFIPKVLEWHDTAAKGRKNVLEVFRGPEFEQLNDKQLEQLFSADFSIAKEYNRMAYQIEEKIAGHAISMLTSATLPGTVQLTSAGKLIVLMKDGQTTGGYPRILQLSNQAIALLAQKKFKDAISFRLI